MSAVNAAAPPRPAGPGELAGVLLLLAALGAAQLATAGAFSLFGRHFWLDEMYSHRLVADPDPGHMLAALRGGVETHPPTFYLLLRGFTRLTGDAGETTLRCFALLAVLAALVGVYAALRLAFVPLVALAAVLALWGHPLVLRHAFEARAYGAWLAAAAWFAYWLARSLAPGRSRAVLLALAVSSVLLCTLHYFGIITAGLVLAAQLWWRRPAGAPRRAALLAVAAGPAALLACLPLLLGQRGATTVATWVKAPDLADVGRFLLSVLLPTYLLLVPLVAAVAWLARRKPTPAPAGPADRTGVVGLAGLALFPAFLIAFSYAVMSVLVDRYALPAVAAVAAAVALLTAGLSRAWLIALCALLTVSGTLHMADLARDYRARDEATDALVAAVRRETDDGLVVFEQPHELHAVCRYGPDVAGRCFLLDFEPGKFGPVSPSRVFNRDLARRFAAFYGNPGLIGWQEVKALPRWYLVPEGGPAGRELAADKECYPGFFPRRLHPGLYELVAPGAE